MLSLADDAHAVPAPRIRAVAFDAFPIFDPRPVFALAEQLFPGRGAELANAWRSRQFEYQWLRALSQQYADFRQATDDSLVYAADLLKLDLTEARRTALIDRYYSLEAWPDVQPALRALEDADIRLGLVSNATPAMLDSCLRHAGLSGRFEQVLSTHRIRTFKPDPRAYQMAIDAFGLRKEEIVFAAFAGWDAAGAKAFGYRTYWVNRLGQPVERLGVSPDGSGADLHGLVTFVAAMNSAGAASR
ncbi:MAG TPA: haloacid dehalogenase type II [Steroidobacteraceae bacterium]